MILKFICVGCIICIVSIKIRFKAIHHLQSLETLCFLLPPLILRLYTGCRLDQNFSKSIICFQKVKVLKDLWHFGRVSAYFSDASQNFPMHKISLVLFWIGRLMYQERINVIIRQAGHYNQTGDATKGGRGYKIWLHQNIQVSIIFTCNGIISSIIDYKSQWK